MSRTLPSWSAARHRYIRSPAIRTTSRRDASDCSAADGTGVAVARSPGRISAPNTGRFRRRCRAPLGEELLDVPITQREAQVEPDRMLDDHRRKAVAAVRDFSHRTSLPVVTASGLSGYPDKAARTNESTAHSPDCDSQCLAAVSGRVGPPQRREAYYSLRRQSAPGCQKPG